MSAEEKSAEAVAYEAAVMQKAEYDSLTRSRAWGMLLAFVADQAHRRELEVMTSCVGTPEELAKRNFACGEYSGLNLVKAFMENELKVSQEAVELYRQALSEKGEE